MDKLEFHISLHPPPPPYWQLYAAIILQFYSSNIFLGAHYTYVNEWLMLWTIHNIQEEKRIWKDNKRSLEKYVQRYIYIYIYFLFGKLWSKTTTKNGWDSFQLSSTVPWDHQRSLEVSHRSPEVSRGHMEVIWGQ